MPQLINSETRPTSTEPSNVGSKKVSGRRIVPLISEESPSSVKSLYAASSSDQNMDATRISPPSPTSPVRPTGTPSKSTAAPATVTTTDRIQRIMNDPEEWSKFQEQMKSGGHVTNAALDQLLKRAREEEEEAKKKAEQETEKGSETASCEDGGAAGVNADREEAGHHSNLVNKGLRWINQTLTAANISQEAEASMNSQLSYRPSSDRSINRSHSVSGDRAIFLEGTLSGGTAGIERSESTGAGGGGQPARRSRRGGRRRDPFNQELDGSVGSVSSSRQLPHRRNSADAVMSLGGYLTTNISAHACEDPMSLKTAKGQHLADTNALFDRQQVFDEDMDTGANISGHLNIPKDDDEGKSNLISETAKAVRRGSGSLVEYLSGITAIGQDCSDNKRLATSGSGDGLLEGWSGGRERRETPGANARSDRINQRGGRRVRSRSFDMLEAMQKGLGHEIDADDFMDGGGH